MKKGRGKMPLRNMLYRKKPREKFTPEKIPLGKVPIWKNAI